MKRRNWLIPGIVLLILMGIGGGAFAVTQLTDTATVGVTGGGEMGSVTHAGYTMVKHPTGALRGDVEPGEVASVTLDADNTCDMMIVVSMVNAGSLHYGSLNLELAVYDKDNVRVGAIQGVNLWIHQTAFQVSYGAGWNGPYKVKVTGGSYLSWSGSGTLSPDLRVTIQERP